MGPPSRARARRHRVLVVWLGVLLLTQRSIITTAAPRRANHTNHTKNTNAINNINTHPTSNDSHVTSDTSNPSYKTSYAATRHPSEGLRSYAFDGVPALVTVGLASNGFQHGVGTPRISRETKMELAYRAIHYYVISVLASVGLAGNAISIAVWSGERAFNPTTFFIKALSVADMVYLSGELLQPASPKIHIIFNSLIYYGLVFSTHLTLAMVVSRWLSVHRPLHVHRWTLISVAVDLPILMLAFFNVSLVRFMCRRSHNAGGISPSPSRRQTEARATQLRHLVAAVVCVSVTTTLTCPVALVVAAIWDFNLAEMRDQCGLRCFTLVNSVFRLLIAFNSAVTTLYYALFASRFRELFWIRWKSCRAACRNPPCVPVKRQRRRRPQAYNTTGVSSL